MRSSMGAMAKTWLNLEVCSNTKATSNQSERFHNEDDSVTLIMERHV